MELYDLYNVIGLRVFYLPRSASCRSSGHTHASWEEEDGPLADEEGVVAGGFSENEAIIRLNISGVAELVYYHTSIELWRQFLGYSESRPNYHRGEECDVFQWCSTKMAPGEEEEKNVQYLTPFLQ